MCRFSRLRSLPFISALTFPISRFENPLRLAHIAVSRRQRCFEYSYSVILELWQELVVVGLRPIVESTEEGMNFLLSKHHSPQSWVNTFSLAGCHSLPHLFSCTREDKSSIPLAAEENGAYRFHLAFFYCNKKNEESSIILIKYWESVRLSRK